MCGIAGILGGGYANSVSAGRMAERISSRGPDDSGCWVDSEAGIAIAHRRLSVVDLTSAGHQPMRSRCGRFVLAYNGEIYNNKELRNDLNASCSEVDWKGHSDTETLLIALSQWGLEGTLEKLNGMFAFALWDAHERTLYLARDRMGEKPLYYGRCKNAFIFGSELKALTAYPEWCGEINRDALALYMRHNYIPAPWSIYHGISKLPQAHYVVIRQRGHHVGDPVCYWDLGRVAEQGGALTTAGPDVLIDKLDDLLRDAVGRRMVADVPLGAFLSGGYDSTTVAALMQAQRRRPVKTFSIGFHEEAYNEAQHARAVADHLGTEHTEFYVTPAEAMAVIPSLPAIYDEPFSDPSQIPTVLVSQLARRHVTVSLSGDGGDELFCGYNRYVLGYQTWNKLRSLPAPLRIMLAGILGWVPAHALDRLQRRLPERLQVSHLADRLPKLAGALMHRDGHSYYRSLVSHTTKPGDFILGACEPETILSRLDNQPALSGLRETMMYLDMMTYLPDDILTKIDRASMAVSLEARVPLLDHRVVEFAWGVPTEYKYRNGHGKWLLRQVLYRYVPRSLMDRPKMGFGVPIEHWLRGGLREWAEELLDENRLREEGVFNPAPIRQMWHEHTSGKKRWHYFLWVILMFQAWLEKC